MELDRARELIAQRRTEIERSLAQLTGDEAEAREDDDTAEPGDTVDVAQELDAITVDDSLVAGLRDKLAALDRADARIADGSYGKSLRSGDVIPDARLEVDPAAELTVEEAAADERA